MSAIEAIEIVDPEGSVMVISRIEDAVYTIGITYADPDKPFRLFEPDRAAVRDFLKRLAG